jgi:hypothetical protein
MQGKVLALLTTAICSAERPICNGSPCINMVAAGSHLNEMFGPRYVVIVLQWVFLMTMDQPARTWHSRSIAGGFAGTVRFIPTYKGHGLSAPEIAALPIRSGSMKNPTYFARTSQCFMDFDWLAFLRSTSYARGGPPLHR